ncbi:hypothetical protein BKI52_08875 [marine bacterium AO1-C]|nr:hypothetical protein BKI52_08875 [marine bacterium AO1-C]
MQKVFKYSSPRRLEATLTNIPIILLLLIFYVFFPKTYFPNATQGWVVYTAGAFFILPIVWHYIAFLNYRLEVASDRFIVHKLLSKTELEFTDFKGYSIGLNITLLHRENVKRDLDIDEDIASQEDLEAFIIQQFELIQENEQKNKQLGDILNNPDFGETPKERQRNFKRSSRVARRLTIFSILTFYHSFFFIRPDSVAIVFWASFFVVLWGVFRKKGLVGLGFPDDLNLYISYLPALFVSTGFISIRAMFLYNLLDYQAIWPYAIPIILGLGLLSYIAARKNLRLITAAQRNQQLFMILIFSLAMGYYTVATINCMFDKTKLTEQRVIVVKTEETDYSYDAIIKLKDAKEIRLNIGQNLYRSMKRGDSLSIYVQQGLLGVPWVRSADKIIGQ